MAPQKRTEIPGKAWEASTDRAWITSGDAEGFHFFIADGANGYAWKEIAALSEPGLETDQWIGNACVTGSGKKAVVVYAPRTFTNKGALFDRGGFTAVIDLTTGAIKKLPVMSSLAYFNPSCGADEDAVLLQGGDEDLGRTRLVGVDTSAATLKYTIEVSGQLTSPVPTRDGIVAADKGALVRVDDKDGRRVLTTATGVPFKLAADADGGVVFMEEAGTGQAAVKRVTTTGAPSKSANSPASPETIVTGSLTKLDVTTGRGGRVFLTGTGKPAAKPTLPPSVSVADAPAGARLSTQGKLAVTSVRKSSQADPRLATRSQASRTTSAICSSMTGRFPVLTRAFSRRLRRSGRN